MNLPHRQFCSNSEKCSWSSSDSLSTTFWPSLSLIFRPTFRKITYVFLLHLSAILILLAYVVLDPLPLEQVAVLRERVQPVHLGAEPGLHAVAFVARENEGIVFLYLVHVIDCSRQISARAHNEPAVRRKLTVNQIVTVNVYELPHEDQRLHRFR